jgi:hypothetical protein
MLQHIFLVKEKASEIVSKFGVPRHEELAFVKELSGNSWIAKSTVTDQTMIIEKKKKGNFYFFEITAGNLSC